LDNDEAGMTVGNKLFKHLPSFRDGVKWLNYSHTKAKDLGEMSDEEIGIAITKATVLPWWVNV
jgi:hypothetical protein